MNHLLSCAAGTARPCPRGPPAPHEPPVLPDAGTVEKWCESLDLHVMIATALEVPDDSSAFEMTRKLSREEVAAKLRDPALIEGLVSGVMQGVDDLQQRVAATGAELSKKFQMEGGQFEMAFGSLDLFFGGLEGVIGPPQMIEGSLHKAVRPSRHAVPHRAMRALGCEPWPQAQCTSGTAAAPPAMPPAIGWRLPPGATCHATCHWMVVAARRHLPATPQHCPPILHRWR